MPYDGLNYQTSHGSDVPEGKGWKQAFTQFTGDKDMATFYAAFDTWAAAATKEDMLAVLETDAAIAALTTGKIQIDGADFVAQEWRCRSQY